MGELGDLLGLRFRAMVAPEIVLVERLQVLADHDDAGAGGVDGERRHVLASDARCGKGPARGARQGVHVIGMGLGRMVRIVPPSVERIIGGRQTEWSPAVVNQGDTYAERAEISARYNGHRDEFP
jgi:hypothetical protein